jgi:PII-like signaling protein
MIADALKLSIYFGDSLTTGGDLAGDALMRELARRQIEVAALLRGIEGFGINRRIHAERFPDISTDLPLLAVAVDRRERIEALLPTVDRVISRGLVTLEYARLATGADVAKMTLPPGHGEAAKLTIYCGRGERSSGRLTYRAIVELLRRQGATGAIVLMGIDGVLRGARRSARVFAVDALTPMVIISVGPAGILERLLPQLGAAVKDPVVTFERIAQLKHDGKLLESPPWRDGVGSDAPDGAPPEDAPDVWHTLRIYTRRSAQVNGRALYSELTRRLREIGGAGATTILGEWGFSSDEAPYGDRAWRLQSHTPSYTVYIDRPHKIAEAWPLVDELTARHGIVTWLTVPGYRERAGTTVHGRLEIPPRL